MSAVFYLNNDSILVLGDTEIKILEYKVRKAEVLDDIKRRVTWVISEQHLKTRYQEMRSEWEPKLIERGYTSLPVSMEEFSALVFSQLDYQDADKRIEVSQNLSK